jgi:predicted PurR-regulated permease PerM
VFHPQSLISIWQGLTEILMPFLCGAVIAYLLNPACCLFEKLLKKLDRKTGKKEHSGLVRMASILLVFIAAFLLIALLLFAIIPQLVSSISGVLTVMPNVVKDFLAWIKTLEQGDTSHELITLITQLTTTISAKVEQFLSNDLLPNMQTLLTEMTSSFLNLFTLAKNFGIGCIVAIYLLSGKEKFLAQAKLVLYSIFSQKWGDRILDELHYTDQMFSGFITAKLLDSAIIGGICFVFCYLVRMPYAMLVSIIVGVTNMIPFFGPYLGAIPSAFLILMESPSKCVLFLIFIIILQQIDGNVIGPRILGDKMGVSGFWVLFAILFFGSIWGLVGMLIGVPVFAVIYDLLRKLIFRGLRQNNQSTMIEQYETQYPRETKKK